MPKVANHSHKLKRHKYETTGNAIFHCTLPDCYFKIDVRLALGKRSLCWRCGKEFIINEKSIRLARPHCDACTKVKSEPVEVPQSTDGLGNPFFTEAKPTNGTIKPMPVESLRDRLNRVSFAAEPEKEI